jgi:hypothetical protein
MSGELCGNPGCFGLAVGPGWDFCRDCDMEERMGREINQANIRRETEAHEAAVIEQDEVVA